LSADAHLSQSGKRQAKGHPVFSETARRWRIQRDPIRARFLTLPPPSLLPLIFQCHRESSRTKERGLITRTRRMAADPHVGRSSSSIFPLDVQIIRSRSPDQDQREERAKERRRCRDLRDRRGAAGASYGPEIGLEAAATLSLLAPSPSLLLPPSRFTLSRSLSTPCGGTLAAIFQRCMPVYTLHQARESYERGECRSRYRSTAEQQRLPERKREREREREQEREGKGASATTRGCWRLLAAQSAAALPSSRGLPMRRAMTHDDLNAREPRRQSTSARNRLENPSTPRRWFPTLAVLLGKRIGEKTEKERKRERERTYEGTPVRNCMNGGPRVSRFPRRGERRRR
jgi:hypothetical protein